MLLAPPPTPKEDGALIVDVPGVIPIPDTSVAVVVVFAAAVSIRGSRSSTSNMVEVSGFVCGFPRRSAVVDAVAMLRKRATIYFS